MNFYSLMILTAIEVGAVGADMSSTLGYQYVRRWDNPLDPDNHRNTEVLHDSRNFHAFVWRSRFRHSDDDRVVFGLLHSKPLILFIGLTHPRSATGLRAGVDQGHGPLSL